jgi:amino acid transporter
MSAVRETIPDASRGRPFPTSYRRAATHAPSPGAESGWSSEAVAGSSVRIVPVPCTMNITSPPNRTGGAIGAGRLVALTFAVVAPATSVFLAYGAAYRTAGDGVVIAYAAAAGINLLVMMCYAEVGSVHPEAGGDYALAARALGPRAGSVFAACFAFKGAALPAVLVLASAAYLHGVLPEVPEAGAAAAMLVVILGVSLAPIAWSSVVAAAMVVMEAAALAVFAAAAAPAAHRAPEVLLGPVASGGELGWLSWAGVLLAAGPALYGLNGAQACLYFSEDSRGAPRTFGRTIMGVAVTTVAVELVMVALATLAVPTHALGASVPLLVVMRTVAGSKAVGRFLVLGVAVALFDAALATTMSYGRVYHAMARDGQWPEPLNRWFRGTAKDGAPRGPFWMMAACNLGMLAVTGLNDLVALLGALVWLMYLGIAGAALVTRRRVARPPYRMPLWPAPPLAAMGALLFLAPYLGRSELAVTGAVVALGLVWSFARPTGAGGG